VSAGLGAVDVLPGVHGAALGPPGETGLERFRLAHRALPGCDLSQVSLRTRLLGAELSAPVLLVGAAARTATELGVGLIGNDHAPDRPRLWLASADAADLRGGVEEAERLVSALEADGLVVRLNGMRDGRMRGASEAIAAVAERLAPLPVLARGGGFGLDAADVRELRAAGVAAIDVGGAAVARWGIPTADSLAEAALAAPGLPLLAEVGDGLDAAKCLALGAAAVTVASAAVEPLLETLRLAVWSAGVRRGEDLTPGHLRQPEPWRPPLA
jgi:isopentenyl diphosphate isomerase/L-lactate dehydrogenase-like FMN-dependent dehydrogenase